MSVACLPTCSVNYYKPVPFETELKTALAEYPFICYLAVVWASLACSFLDIALVVELGTVDTRTTNKTEKCFLVSQAETTCQVIWNVSAVMRDCTCLTIILARQNSTYICRFWRQAFPSMLYNYTLADHAFSWCYITRSYLPDHSSKICTRQAI